LGLDETATFFNCVDFCLLHRGMTLDATWKRLGAIMAVGTVKFFNTVKGFGFITPEGGGKDVFVHVTAVEAAGMGTLTEGQKVQFDIEPDARGSKAANLRPAE
jgi:CspA family cold shock protein